MTMTAPQVFSVSQQNRLMLIRRELHAHPQPGYEEVYASRLVQNRLDEWKIPFEAGVATTGVVAWLKPRDPLAMQRPAVALRADMDALPITERTSLPYASRRPGFMHACGHDGHTAILLGVALCLHENRHHLSRPVKLLFQPAEESGAGAARMIRAGALTDRIGGFAAEAIVGFHNWPGLPMGSVAVGDGPVMAGADRLRITVEGRGGHAAMPHLTDDVNVAASALVQALQTIISRRRRFTDAALLSICQLQAGHSNNVLPGHAALDGTLRYLDPDLRGLMHDEVHRICKGIGIAFGCRISAEFDSGYPPTINDAALAEAAERIATENGLDVVIDQLPTGAAEDFAFYGRHVPSVYLKLGADDRSGPRPGLHTDQFDFNDALITPAVELLSSLAVALP